MKVCSRCKKRMSIDCFPTRKNHKGTIVHIAMCRTCKYQSEDKEKRKASNVRYRNRMRDKYGSLFTKHHSMMMRCYNKTNSNYKYYGGKGISVCSDWHDLDLFFKWSKESGFVEGLEIDRIDSNGDYEPKNCRFISQEENKRRKSNVIINKDIAKKIKEMWRDLGNQCEVARRLGIGRSIVHKVVNNKTWR